MVRNVGILGGTFDPPHLGHLVVAECARVELELDEVRLLVAGQPWMKDVDTPASVRVELAQLAVTNAPGLVVDDRETRRAGTTYTADTVDELAAEEPGTTWWLLVGDDLVVNLGQWHRADDLRAAVELVAVTREGHDPPPDGAVDHRLDVPAIGISSTELRDRYRTGRATRHLVPPAVDDAIRRVDLYGGASGPQTDG